MRFGGCANVAESEVFGWSHIPNTRSRVFCPTPEVQLDHFTHHTSMFGIPVEMMQFLWNFVETDKSCCAPRFPLITSCYKIVDSQNRKLRHYFNQGRTLNDNLILASWFSWNWNAGTQLVLSNKFIRITYVWTVCSQLLLVFRLRRKIIQNELRLNNYSVNHLSKQETLKLSEQRNLLAAKFMVYQTTAVTIPENPLGGSR